MGRLVVLQTSPRLPAGLLSRSAWQALDAADRVAAADPHSPLVKALTAQDIEVVPEVAVSAGGLLQRAAGEDVVWLWDGATERGLLDDLAAEAVRRADGATEEAGGVAADPQIEVLVGSFDPVGARLLDLVEVMDRLRRECPWDQRQTHESLVRYLLEETYETVEAIETGDRQHLGEELGDLLLQVLFHARIAAEHPDAPFTIDDVAAGIVDKLIRRHPHVFADQEVAGVDDVEANWETIKAAEKARGSAMDGIPLGLPALSLAHKVVSRGYGSGVPLRGTVSGATGPSPASTSLGAEQIAEALLTLVVAAHELGLDPEQLLRRRVREQMAEVRSEEQRALTDQGRGRR